MTATGGRGRAGAPAYLLGTTGVPPPVSLPARVDVGWQCGPMAISLAQEGLPVLEFLN